MIQSGVQNRFGLLFGQIPRLRLSLGSCLDLAFLPRDFRRVGRVLVCLIARIPQITAKEAQQHSGHNQNGTGAAGQFPMLLLHNLRLEFPQLDKNVILSSGQPPRLTATFCQLLKK